MSRQIALSTIVCSIGLLVGIGCGSNNDEPVPIDEDAAQEDTGNSSPDAGDRPDTGDESDTDESSDTDECTLATCDDLGAECGTRDDGCGGTIECGSCDQPNASCNDGTCECTPDTCDDIGAQCGQPSDGCGGTLECGECSGDREECVDGACECQPRESCFDLDAECGQVDDGCGGTLQCDDCNSGRKCVDNSCEVDPETCTELGTRCSSDTCCEGQTCGYQSPETKDCRQRCCVPNGGSCEQDSDCCGTQTGSAQCVADPNCHNGTCCQTSTGLGAVCETDADCCGDTECGRNGLCG